MPELRFQIQWPDGSRDLCYSPSLVVKEYFTVGQRYPLDDFQMRSHLALTLASERVQAKYGTPCSRALNQNQQIQRKAAAYRDWPEPYVHLLQFLD